MYKAFFYTEFLLFWGRGGGDNVELLEEVMEQISSCVASWATP